MALEFEGKELDSPLVVHKPSDASYQETANSVDVDFTHTDSGEVATLERHRYRKVKKPKKWPYVVVAVVIAVAILLSVLYFTGVFKPKNDEGENVSNTQVVEENRYENIITVKGTYLFFEGEEINGAQELESNIKYLEDSDKFIVQNENADEVFLKQEILPLLDNYGIKYQVKTVVSSGLHSQFETNE